MKLVPDPGEIPQGYLFAFLKSRFGLPMIVTGTYGSIIEHIEPEHIEDLPVPRLGDEIETRIHEKVEAAASRRVEATRKQQKAGERLQEEIGIEELEPVVADKPFHTGSVQSDTLDGKLTALYHSDYHRTVLDRLKSIDTLQVREAAESIVEPPRFKRIEIDNPQHGIPFFSTSAIMRIEPDFDYYLPKEQDGIEQYIVDETTVLIPRSGQLNGLIGHAVLPYGKVVGGAVTEHAIRVNCDSKALAGYLYVALASETGRRQLKSRAYGSSIPTLNVSEVGKVLVPALSDSLTDEIGTMGFEVARLRDEAIDLENEAIRDVESTIKRMSNGES
jgi:type I restriction enzyme S subunit